MNRVSFFVLERQSLSIMENKTCIPAHPNTIYIISIFQIGGVLLQYE